MIFLIPGKIHDKIPERVVRIRGAHPDIQLRNPSFNTLQCLFPVQQDILVRGFSAPVLRKFPNRLLIQAPVLKKQFTRQAHLAEPGALLIAGCFAGIPVLHPADHHAPSVRGQNRLRRVKVDPVIDRLVMLLDKPVSVHSPCEADSTVAVMVFKTFREHILRADKQHLLSVQREEIRAFPHEAEPAVILGQYADIPPFKSVPAFILEQDAALILPAGSHYAPVPAVLRPPDLRIPEIIGAQALRKRAAAQNRVLFIFLIIRSVSDGNALGLVLLCLVTAFLPHAGIHQQVPSVRQFSRAA